MLFRWELVLDPPLLVPFHRPRWVYEEKIDGYRMLAVKDGSRVRLLSRRGYEIGDRFPGIVDSSVVQNEVGVR